MVAVILIWLYAGTLIFIYGVAALRLLQWGGGNHFRGSYPPFAVIALLGLTFLTTITGYLSLVIKIALGANLVIVAGAAIFLVLSSREVVELLQSYRRDLSRADRILDLAAGIAVVFILVKSTGPPTVVDTGLYHAQAIRWIAEYPVVPGLGNLHGRLAFNSAWFLPNALFSLAFLPLPPFHALSGLLLLMVVTLCFAGARNLWRGEYAFSNLLKAAVLIPFLFLFQYHLSSPATDLPAALLIVVTFIYYGEIIESGDDASKPQLDLRLAVIVALSVFAVTVKLSALPLAIFMGYIMLRELVRRRWRNFFRLAAMVAMIFLPWLIRNVVLSGYLIYPFPALDLFSWDWKIPRQAVLLEKTAIANYARNPGLIPDAVAQQGISYWLPAWIQYVATAYRKKLVMIALPSGIMLVGAVVGLSRVRSFGFRRELVWQQGMLYLTALAGGLFWFVNAPDLRLGYGFLIVLSLIIYLPLADLYRGPAVTAVLSLLCICFLYFAGAFLAQDALAVKDRWLFPAPYPAAPLKEYPVGSQVVYVPVGTRGCCWNAPLPCTPQAAPRLEFRGDSLGDGFRCRWQGDEKE